MKTYKTLAALIADIEAGKIPSALMSPGGAAGELGVTRQAINDRIHNTKTLDAWGAEGYVLISVESVERAKAKKKADAKK